MLVKDIMSTTVALLAPEATIEELGKLLKEKRISGVPVVDSSGVVVGVVTMTDLLRLVGEYFSWYQTDCAYSLTGWEKEKRLKVLRDNFVTDVYKKPISEIMNDMVIGLKEDDSIEEAMKLMFVNNIHTLPVLRDGKLIGIVGKHDLLDVGLGL